MEDAARDQQPQHEVERQRDDDVDECGGSMALRAQEHYVEHEEPEGLDAEDAQRREEASEEPAQGPLLQYIWRAGKGVRHAEGHAEHEGEDEREPELAEGGGTHTQSGVEVVRRRKGGEA